MPYLGNPSKSYLLILMTMNVPQRNLKVQKNLQKIKEVDNAAIDRLIEANLSGKLDSYLKRYAKPDQEILLNITLEEDAKNRFSGSLLIKADGTEYHSSRDMFDSLEDLVNHLFDHIKEQMTRK